MKTKSILKTSSVICLLIAAYAAIFIIETSRQGL